MTLLAFHRRWSQCVIGLHVFPPLFQVCERCCPGPLCNTNRLPGIDRLNIETCRAIGISATPRTSCADSLLFVVALLSYHGMLFQWWHREHTFHLTGPLWGWILLTKGQQCGALISSLLAWTGCWIISRVVGDHLTFFVFVAWYHREIIVVSMDKFPVVLSMRTFYVSFLLARTSCWINRLDQNCLGQWFVAWRHQAITWTNNTCIL